MREEIGDAMQKLKKVATVAVMVGGLGLVGGGVASANAAHGLGDYPDDIAVNNLQVVECEQSFDSDTLTLVGPELGDQEANVGNFCTVIGD
ncbi:hypothetical protein ACFYOV_15605 [Streptomyces sp. NPDC005931]|uniref:hypothetical protein n=1 Tax=Streptomyces sp. NPDC005931 TaxID=3364737 RepID=UPI0036AD65FF